MKYAIIQISGKQFIVKPGYWCDIDFLKNTKPGENLLINKILFFKNIDKIQIGKPFLVKSFLLAKILKHVKGNKITVLKTKPKKKYTRTKGHKQLYTRIQIK